MAQDPTISPKSCQDHASAPFRSQLSPSTRGRLPPHHVPGNKRTQGNGISKDTLKKARKLTGLQAATEKPTGNMHAFLQKGPQTGPKATSASTGTRKPQGTS